MKLQLRGERAISYLFFAILRVKYFRPENNVSIYNRAQLRFPSVSLLFFLSYKYIHRMKRRLEPEIITILISRILLLLLMEKYYFYSFFYSIIISIIQQSSSRITLWVTIIPLLWDFTKKKGKSKALIMYDYVRIRTYDFQFLNFFSKNYFVKL